MKLSALSGLVVVTMASQVMASDDSDWSSLKPAPVMQDVVVHDDLTISPEELTQMGIASARNRAIIEESEGVVLKSKGSFTPPQDVSDLMQQAEAQLEIFYSLEDLNEKEEYRNHLFATFNQLNENPYICNVKESRLLSQMGTDEFASEVKLCKKLCKRMELISRVVQPLVETKSNSRALRRVDSMELIRRSKPVIVKNVEEASAILDTIKIEMDLDDMNVAMRDAREALSQSRKARLEQQSSGHNLRTPVDLSEFLKSPAGQELPHLCEELKDLVKELPKLKDFDSVINACARACELRDVLMSHPFVLNQSKGKEEAEGVDLSEQEAYVREEIARLLTATQIAMDMAERNLGNFLG